jgi:hypothetical protein
MKRLWIRFCQEFASKKSEKVDKYFVFKLLDLSTFSDTELKASYSRLFGDGKSLRLGLKNILVSQKSQRNDSCDLDKKVEDIAGFLNPKTRDGTMTDMLDLEEYKRSVKGVRTSRKC